MSEFTEWQRGANLVQKYIITYKMVLYFAFGCHYWIKSCLLQKNILRWFCFASRHIVPILNPDGYEYTHTHDRMWRKNRAKHDGERVGVDLNRNFRWITMYFLAWAWCCMFKKKCPKEFFRHDLVLSFYRCTAHGRGKVHPST